MLANASLEAANAGTNRQKGGTILQQNFSQTPHTESAGPNTKCRVFTNGTSPSPHSRDVKLNRLDDVRTRNNFTVKEATTQKKSSENLSPEINSDCTNRRDRKRLRVTFDLRRLRLRQAALPKIRVNHGFCDICRQNGMDELVCCDRCPRSFHPSCIYLSISVLELSEWFCEHCTLDLTAGHLEKACGISQVVHIINAQGPHEFCLPKEILDAKVYAPAKGIGVDVHTPEKENSKLLDYQGFRNLHPGTSFRAKTNAQQDIGECCKCGSRTNPDQLLSCGLCPLSWHQYCLSAPVIYPKGGTEKWMCPNHPEHLQPQKSPLGQRITPNSTRDHNAIPGDETELSFRTALNYKRNDRSIIMVAETERPTSETSSRTQDVCTKKLQEDVEKGLQPELLFFGGYGGAKMVTPTRTIIDLPTSLDRLSDVSRHPPAGIAHEIHARRSSSGGRDWESSEYEEEPLVMYFASDLGEPVDFDFPKGTNEKCETINFGSKCTSAQHTESDEVEIIKDVDRLYRIPERTVQSTFIRAVKRIRRDETYAIAKKRLDNDESMRDVNKWCNSLKELKSIIDSEVASNPNDDQLHHDALLRVILENAIECSTGLSITQSDYTSFLAFKRLIKLRKDGKISFPPPLLG